MCSGVSFSAEDEGQLADAWTRRQGHVEANPLRAGMVDTNRPWPAFPAALIRPEAE